MITDLYPASPSFVPGKVSVIAYFTKSVMNTCKIEANDIAIFVKSIREAGTREAANNFLAGNGPFTEILETEFEKLIGYRAKDVRRMQLVADREAETGRPHSGRWLKSSNYKDLAPE